MESILTVTTAQVSGITAYAGELFTDLSLVIVLIIGLPLAFWILRRTISLVRAR